MLHCLQRARMSPARQASLPEGSLMVGSGEVALLSSNNLMAVETNSAYPTLIGFGDNGAADMQRLSLLTPSLSAEVAGVASGVATGVGAGGAERHPSLDTLLAEPPLQADAHMSGTPCSQSGTPTWLRPFHNDDFSMVVHDGSATAHPGTDSGASMHDSAFSTDGGRDGCGAAAASKLALPTAPSPAASLYAHWVQEPTPLAALGPHKSAPPVLPMRKLASSGTFGAYASPQRGMTPFLDAAGSHGFRPIGSCGLSTADIHGMASSLIGTAPSPGGSGGDLSSYTMVKPEPDLSMVPGLLQFQAASRYGFYKSGDDACASPEGPPAKRSASGNLGSPLSTATTWSHPALRPSSLSEPPLMPFGFGGRGAACEAPVHHGFAPQNMLHSIVSCSAQP